MEDKYTKTLENVLILADDEVMEICTKKSFNDTYLSRIPQEKLKKEKFGKLLSKRKKRHHFGLNIKEKRLHKKCRHYTMKIMNFNTVLLQDKIKKDYYVVFYRSDLLFNANIANFYFSGVTKRKQSKRRRRVMKKPQSVSFKNYLKQTIHTYYVKFLNGESSVISVHAIFTVNNAQKSKIFITRDIERRSDINKFIKMMDSFDPTYRNHHKRIENCLEHLKIPARNILAVTQINPTRKKLFIKRNDKLLQSLGKRQKVPRSLLVNTNKLNLHLDHVKFNGVDCTNVKSFVNIIEELVSKNIQDETIEKRLEKQLNSCKTFIACLDAFETTQISHKICRIEPKVEEIEDCDTVSINSDNKVQEILSKIDVLQKRIRTLVKTSPSLHKDMEIQSYLKEKEEEDERTDETAEKLDETGEKTDGTAETTEKTDGKTDGMPPQDAELSKPDDANDLQGNLVKIEAFLQKDFQKNKLQIEGLLRNPPDDVPSKIEELKSKLENVDIEFEKFSKVVHENKPSADFKRIIKNLAEKYQKPVKPVKSKPAKITAKRPKSATISKRTFSNLRYKKPTQTEPTEIKLENFIDQILKITKSYFAPPPDPSKALITIKKFTEMDDDKSEMSTETMTSFVRKQTSESAAQTERKKRKLHTKLTQTDLSKLQAVAMETQTDISIHKHAQIKFSGMSMQLSKNVTITNVRKNVINVRNICEETSEAVKRLLEKERCHEETNLKQVVETISEDLKKGNNKAEILGQIKNTLENVIDRFKKSTLLISKASNFADMTENLKKIIVPSESMSGSQTSQTSQTNKKKLQVEPSKKELTSNLTMSLKLLKNLSEVTKTIRKNPREAAKKLHGIRNELMHYRKNGLYTSKIPSHLYLPKTSSTLTSRQSKNNRLFPKDVPLNMYGYPASKTNLKPDLNELNRIFTPKTRSICNTELSIIKHRDRHADHIASHLDSHQLSKSKFYFDFKNFRSKSAQLKSHKCQMYIAKTYKKSYANSLSQTTCTPPNVPQIQTAIENPLVPKIVRPVRWKRPLPDSPQLSQLSLKDVKPFNSEYPRKDHVSASTHSYLNRLLDDKVPLIKCSDEDCSKCSPGPAESPHFKTVKPDKPDFDFNKFMLDPVKNLNLPKVSFTVCPVNIIQKQEKNPQVIKKLSEVKQNQNKVQKSIQDAIVQNQEKFQAMQRILTLTKEKKPQPTTSLNFGKVPPKIKSTHTKKITKISDASTSKNVPKFPPQQSASIQTAVAAYRTVKQVQPHPKLKQMQQQQQIPPKPKINKIVPVQSKSFDKKYSDVSLTSLKTLTLKEEKAKIQKTVKKSQEDIQKYITLVEQKFLKTFSLNEQEKEGAYKNLVDEIQGMLNVLNSKDKVEKKTKIKKSLEKLSKEVEKKTPILQPVDPVTSTFKTSTYTTDAFIKTDAIKTDAFIKTDAIKTDAFIKTDSAQMADYVKTLENVENSLKSFQNDCEENTKISEAVTEKLQNWKTLKSDEVESVSSTHFTLSEKERLIEEKLLPTIDSVVMLKDPVSMVTTDQSGVKKKNSDFSGPTIHSTTLNSCDSLTDEMQYSGLSMKSFSKTLQKKKLYKSQSAQKYKSPTSTTTSLIPSNDNTEDGYLTINEFSGSDTSIKITPLVEFLIEIYLIKILNYSQITLKCQKSHIPLIYEQIRYFDQIDQKPITKSYIEKYNLIKPDISSSLNFGSILSDESYTIEQEFIKNYSDKIFSESINNILSKSDSSSTIMNRKSSNFYEYIDLLSNISRIFIEPEIAQFYQPKFTAYSIVPLRQRRINYTIIIFCYAHFDYFQFNLSDCNLLEDSLSHIVSNSDQSLAQIVSNLNDSSLDQIVSNLNDSSLIDFDDDSEPFYSVKNSITKFESFNDDFEIRSIQIQQTDEELEAKLAETDEIEEKPPEDLKRLSDKLAQQSTELTQLIKKTDLPVSKLVSVKHKFPSAFPIYDCNYDLRLTISPKYLATNFPSVSSMQIMPLLRNRIGSMSHSLTMKIELNKNRSLMRGKSFKKPKKNFVVYNINQRSESLRQKFSLMQQVQNKEYTESYKLILIFLYVSIFSIIFICMTLNYKCD